MRRFVSLLGLALLGSALLPAFAHAQVVYVQPGRVYAAPIVIVPPPTTTYYAAPSITTYSSSATYSYYPSGTVVTQSYASPSGTVVYSASSAPTIVTYSAPAVLAPPVGVITTRTGYGYGIFRPRGYYTESYYTPLR